MKWVIGAFVFFALFIGTLSIVCMRQDINLVSATYYQDELVHQQKMNQQKNLLELAEQPVITLANSHVSISFASLATMDKGEVRLARPSDPKLDQHFDLSNQATQSFQLTRWEKGLYRVTMTWSMQGKDYYFEKLMVL
jgi:nitrogen fixation protein FixH